MWTGEDMLTADEIAEIERLAAHYDHKRAAAIEALLVVQRRAGWVSDEDLGEIGALLRLAPAEMENVASFYSLILREQVGRHVVFVCDSVSCWIAGCTQIAEYFKACFGIGFGETTPDKRFTLIPIACLGACDRAPVMIIDRDTYFEVPPAELETILDRYR